MKRLVFRFFVVLLAGAAILYLATLRDTPDKPAETPNIDTGPLGDMGTRIDPVGRGVQINPIRDVVLTLHEKIPSRGETGSLFQPIAELRGRKAEIKSRDVVQVQSAVFVREVGKNLPDKSLERRNLFEAVAGYVPPTILDARAAGAKTSGAVERGEKARAGKKRRISHVRIQATMAERISRDEAQWIHFYGSPPDGVKITLFEGVIPVLEARTDRLTCFPVDRHDRSVLRVYSDSLVSLFTPDASYELSGTGLRSRLVDSKNRSASDRGAITLLRGIRFDATDARAHRPEKKQGRRVVDHRSRISCDGPAHLVLRRLPSRKKGDPVVVDALQLHNTVHAEDFTRTKNLKRGGMDNLRVDLRCDFLHVRIQERQITSTEARGRVQIRSRHGRTGNGGSAGIAYDSDVTARGERAMADFKGSRPVRIRIFGWSATVFRSGILLGTPIHVAGLRHAPPEIEGYFTGTRAGRGHFHARSDREIALDNIGQDAKNWRGSLSLTKNIVVDMKDLVRGDNRRTSSWLPGSSRIKIRDRFVLTRHDEKKRLLDFIGTGHVRIETLLGNLEAEEVRGVARDPDHWRIEATGRPSLNHPVASRRSTPGLEDFLRSFSLAPPVSADRPSEASGHILVEGDRATFDLVRTKKRDGKELVTSDVRFAGLVKVTQQEISAEPIRLYCQDLSFSSTHGKSKNRAGIEPSSFRALDNVVVEAGDSFRASGDSLVLDTRALKSPPEGAPKRSGSGMLVGLPARITAVNRVGGRAVLEGNRLLVDGAERSVVAETGVFARIFPIGGSFVVPGSGEQKASVKVLELEADSAVMGWTEARDVRYFRADDAVRIRGFDRIDKSAPGWAPTTDRLLHWGAATSLVYELVDSRDTKASSRRITLVGDADHPVRLGYRDPGRPEEGDFLLTVPVIVMEGQASGGAGSKAIGYGPGSFRFKSQENVFGSIGLGGSKKGETILVEFKNGFRMLGMSDELFRLSFPDGGEVTSRTRDGRLEAWISASKELALLLNNTERKEEDDFRVVERGYAAGDVLFKYGEDTRGGCDKAFWERGTNILTIVGSPAWGEKAGEGRQEFKKMTYNRATRKFDFYSGSGRLKRRFQRKENP